ncbi:MAG: S-layer homology domain-containing protein [Clostridia bacterium]|nr:S-layer homology domain-containing protein [Clostridia bacterium]
MKNKIFSVLVLLSLLISALVLPGNAETYWDAQEAYFDAVDSGDDDASLSAVERIEAIYTDPSDETEYLRLMFPQMKAAEIYEKRGQFVKSSEYYGKFLAGARFMQDAGNEYRDYLNPYGMLYRHNSITPKVYAETSDVTNVPYYYSRSEERAGVAHGMCSYFDAEHDSSQILYVQFFNESVEGFRWQLPEVLDEDYLLLVAWNVPNENYEDLARIASGEADEYIKENLEYLAKLDCRVLIRFGAEVNCWSSLPSTQAEYDEKGQAFIDIFKEAFIRVSDMAKDIAPNCGMVYSPNDISSWFFTFEDFYPGDEYVDWVGISAYLNKPTQTEFSLSNGNDAYYCRGDYYGNQLVKIAPIVEAFGDRKPIIITEGGYCYNSSNGVQTPEFAREAMRYFYTYVTRVYPCIKAVNYFNANYGGNSYRLFGEDPKNTELADLYRELVDGDAAMRYSITHEGNCGYVEFKDFDEINDELKLSVYASYPTTEPITVKYEIDALPVKETTEYPFSLDLSVSSLGVGGHFLKITVSCMKTETVFYYKVNVASDGRVTVSDAVPETIKDVPPKFWGYEACAFAMSKGLMGGTSESTFDPNKPLTRGMFVTILGRLSGVDGTNRKSAPFTDVADGKWYTPYVAWAAENGIVNGVSETRFAPNDNITREQMCTIFVRYSDTFGLGLDKTPEPGEVLFADDAKIRDYARECVYTCLRSGLVGGKGNGRFDPRATATRAEAATIFMRFMKYCNDMEAK